MEIEILKYDLTVCKVKTLTEEMLNGEFFFLGKTDEELSLVCPTEAVSFETSEREDGWRAFRFCGVLDFSLIGILAKAADLLAEQGISIFAVSTYNTDYVLTRAAVFDRATEILKAAGYKVIE